MSIDAVPDNIDVEKIKQTATKIDGVLNLHHVHIWAVNTTQNALTGHLTLAINISKEQINKIKQ